ncbi:MAG: oxidoreductase [Alphaproteobacteria bacterium]|nr:oxidoreductase [Alphaproteobacteria bacterium]
MPDIGLIVCDPGHFHAALVQKEMYSGLAAEAHVYAPLGPDLADYLARIARFNARAEQLTDWRLRVHAAPDFLDRMRREPPGGAVIFSGRNRRKIERIGAALAAGLHVLADKPIIIRREDLPALEQALKTAEQRGLLLYEIMTGRHDTMAALLRELRADPDLFGETLAGSPNEPAVELKGVHHLLKRVAGVPNPRPAWYFDTAEQGEGLADTGTHLVDRVHETLFPDRALDHARDIRIDAAERWPTVIGLAEFREITGETGWPEALTPWLRDGALHYYCNGRVCYAVRGIHVALDARWDWQAAAGDDRHEAAYRGSRARLELRQGAPEGYRQQLYIVPMADIETALHRRIAALQESYPGVAIERQDRAWRVVVPEELRPGHEAHFAALTRRFLERIAQQRPLSRREEANMLAKYYVCTEAVALSRTAPPSDGG